MFSNGNKELVYIYLNPNDKADFIRESYFSNGQIEMQGRLKNDTQEGQWIWWYENGNKKDEATFLKGVYIKERKHWRENGTRLSFEFFSDKCSSDCCDGKTITFDSLNRIRLIVNRKNGNRNGKTITLFPNGKIDKINNYSNGLLQGMTYEFHPNGKPKVHGIYNIDKEQGKWVYSDTLGQYIGYEIYKDGIVISKKVID
jgi:antitoxin component YwqK of YwqJK toxin-antitoxin module